jgi:hypothetical protein
MYGVGDAGRAVAKPRQGHLAAGLISGDQNDPGTHSCERYRRNLANPGRAPCDDNSLSPHHALVSILGLHQELRRWSPNYPGGAYWTAPDAGNARVFALPTGANKVVI